MPVRYTTEPAEALARATRDAQRMHREMQASATTIGRLTRVFERAVELALSDPESAAAVSTVAEAALEKVSEGSLATKLHWVRSHRPEAATPSPEDDASDFGPNADALDQELIAAARARLAAGETHMIPHEVVKGVIEGHHRVRAWREYRGMTQAELARRARLTQGAVADIERGRRSAGRKAISRIAEALDAPESALLD